MREARRPIPQSAAPSRQAPAAASAESTPGLHAMTLAMTGLATLAVEVATADAADGPARTWLGAGAMIGLAALAAWMARSRRRFQGATRAPGRGRLVIGLLAVVGLGPLAWQLMAAGGRGGPWEAPLLHGCRNVALGLAVLSCWSHFLRLAGLLDLFLVLVACSLIEGREAVVLSGGFAVIGSLWLMALYWARQGHAHGPAAPRFPFAVAGAAVVVVGGVVAAAGMGPGERAVQALNGFLPTSGGTRSGALAARGGVGDGIDQAHGGNPSSVGYDGGNAFADSPHDSLYDIFIENYGSAMEMKDVQKAFGLKPDQLLVLRRTIEMDLRSGRTFSLLRRPPAPPAPGAARAANALFSVAGPTPMHLRMAVYDRFDGLVWEPSTRTDFSLTISNSGGGPWMTLDGPGGAGAGVDAEGGIQRRELFFGRFDRTILPLPARLKRLRMGKVDRPDFFKFAPGGVLALARRRVAPGTVLEIESAPLDPDRLLRLPPGRPPALGLDRPYLFPAGDAPPDPAMAALADQWTRGVPRGWAQVQAVVSHLREGYAVVPPGTASPGTEQSGPEQSGTTGPATTQPASAGPDAVGDFLFRSRRGPDYLFASSAALLLRTLGYPTRLVSGFYVNPSRYDAGTGQTPVTSRDLHFWVEVRLPDDSWAPVEPTPGYDMAGPSVAWYRRWLAAARNWAVNHFIPLVCGGTASAVAMAALLALRSRIADALAMLLWRLRVGREPRRRAVATLRLIDWRLCRAGRPRPAGLTPARWFESLGLDGREPCEAVRCRGRHESDLAALAAFADWAAFAPPGAALPWQEERVEETCRRLVRDLPIRRLRPPAPARRSRRGRTDAASRRPERVVTKGRGGIA